MAEEKEAQVVSSVKFILGRSNNPNHPHIFPSNPARLQNPLVPYHSAAFENRLT